MGLLAQIAANGYSQDAALGLISAWDLKGAIACVGEPNYPAADKGHAYVVSSAGKVGGAAGTVVEVGDMILAIADNAGGTQAAVGASWTVLEHNVSGAEASIAATLAATAVNTASTIVKRGAAGEVAVGAITGGALNGMTFRKIASGTWAVAELSANVFGPFVRTAGEVVQVFAFVDNDVEDAAWSWSDGSVNDVCNIRVQRRVTAHEFDVVVTKPSAGARTLRYVIVGITP